MRALAKCGPLVGQSCALAEEAPCSQIVTIAGESNEPNEWPHLVTYSRGIRSRGGQPWGLGGSPYQCGAHWALRGCALQLNARLRVVTISATREESLRVPHELQASGERR